MKMNKKGFMLAEVVVVSVVIATVLVTLFIGLNNVTSAYRIRNKYYDVDSLYVAMEINDILRANDNIANLINNNNVVSLYGKGYGIDEFANFYKNKIKYDISSIYFVPYDSEKLEQIKDDSINVTFKDYVDYLGGNLIFDEDYNYMIIVERENNSDEDDCYYYTLKLKY